jgi:ABC-type branched-subunit amino acid transport system substrate-binding protein
MINIRKLLIILLLSSSVSATYYYLFRSIDGITKDKIVIGQSCALSGPAAALGIGMRDGALAYFNHINDNGGVNGRKIELITYDDKYEPKLALENSKKLIQEDKVFALFGEVGTPTSLSVLPYIKDNQIPFLTPFTGAQKLRDIDTKYIINFRASYYAETQKIVEYLVDELGHTKIAIFYQNDSYGEAGLNGVKKALSDKKMELVAKGIYRRNTLSITNALYKITEAKPDSVIIIGAYKQSALFIKRAKQMGLDDAVFANISFVGSKSLMSRLGDDTDNVIISQVVPLPFDSSNKSVKEYQEVFSKYYPNSSYGFVSLEGFLSAKLVVEALQKSGKRVNRDKLIYALERIDSSKFEGIKISLSQFKHQAMDEVFLTNYIDNSFRLIDEKN